MCSFIFTDKPVYDIDNINYFTKFRGPDYTSHITYSGFTFIHNLLSITGEFITQPFIDKEIFCMYNGEIYDYEIFGDYDSDGKCLIPLYEKFGSKFITKLDGEFAIVIVDFNNRLITLSSDIFRTKPIFYSYGKNNISCSTYRTPLESLGYKSVIELPPNTTIIINMDSGNIIKTFNIIDFDLNQHKTTFDDWDIAFKNSIRKRTKKLREKLFLGFSSGYDSGAICCELQNQNIPFSTYTVMGTENNDILSKRFNLMKDYVNIVKLTKFPHEISTAHNHITNKTENYKYVTYSNSSNYNEYWLSLVDDNGSNHLSHVCSHAIRDGKKIFLSGQGADEIFSDYGFNGIKKYNHSNFGGLFPSDLSVIFPWPSFFGSSMASYLAKEEYVAGSYGIEARYPFLDKDVVQEFLWLTSNLKNSHYKSVLHNYLVKNNYPFKENEKIGF